MDFSEQNSYDNFAPSGCAKYFEKIYDSDTDNKISFSVSKWGGVGGCGFEIWDHKRNKYWIDVDDNNIIKKITEGPQAKEKQALLVTIPKEERTFDSLFTLFPEGFREKKDSRKRDPFEKKEYFELNDQFGDNGETRKQNRETENIKKKFEFKKTINKILKVTQDTSINLSNRKDKWSEYYKTLEKKESKKIQQQINEYYVEVIVYFQIKGIGKIKTKLENLQCGFDIWDKENNYFFIVIDPIFDLIKNVYHNKNDASSLTLEKREILSSINEENRTGNCLFTLFPEGFKPSENGPLMKNPNIRGGKKKSRKTKKSRK